MGNLIAAQTLLVAKHAADAAPSWKTSTGQPGVTVDLSNGSWVASPWLSEAIGDMYAFIVDGVLAGCGGGKVRVESQLHDPQNPALYAAPQLVDTVRCDQPAAGPVAEQHIIAANLLHGSGAGADQVRAWGGVGPAAEPLSVKLLTPDAMLGRVRVLVQADAGTSAGDIVRIGFARR